MIWDFRHLVRRGGGGWPRDWRDGARRPIRPPGGGKETGERRPGAGEPKPEDPGCWLEPRWQPPPDAADAWKK